MAMRWHDLLFAHWPLKPEVLRPLVPAGLELDTFDGEAWIAVVPFRMTGIRHRLGPPLPWLSAFLELNVRTYVKRGGHSGVWFFSLDAANPVAVRAARWRFHLPYFDARMRLTATAGDKFQYASLRTHRGAPPAQFEGRYRPIGKPYESKAGDIDHWLTERYCLFSADRRGQIHRGDIHHVPWPLQPAEAEIQVNTMTEPLGMRLPDTPPLLHFASRLDVVAWLLESC